MLTAMPASEKSFEQGRWGCVEQTMASRFFAGDELVSLGAWPGIH